MHPVLFCALDKEKEPENWKNLHVGEVDGISCQHLQVMMTNSLQKRWEWQEARNHILRHGSVVRPTMYLASLDIKTAFNEAKPKHVAQILDCHDTHGWLIVALLREILRGEQFHFQQMLATKEAWRLHVCGRKWPLRFGPMWKRNG